MDALKLPPAQRLRIRENQVFLILTIVVGVLAGLSAVLFTVGIELTTRYLFGLAPSHARLFIVPAGVSVLTGILLSKVFPDVRGSGVPQTEAAYQLSNGVMKAHVPFGKFVTGILCIGSGHSMGREGPSVQIGAGLASVIGQWLHLPPRRVRDLVPVGAAGALAAAFNTPVAAVLFALEEIIGDMNAPLLGSTVVASVAAVVVERAILGNEPLFRVPTYQLVHPGELAAYAALGVIGGGVSIVFCKALLGLRRLVLAAPPRTRLLQPPVGGVIIGMLLLYSPAVMGVGYEYVDQALNGGLVLRMFVMLCVLKIAATVVSYASGNAGGIFAPSLYIGAMAGGALGVVVHTYAPFPTAAPGAYALVGMGTLFAGIIRAPMTSVFMIFEITQDYQILVPLMLANMLSFTISRRFQPVPVYHALLRQDNVHLPAASTDDNDTMVARDVMRPSVDTSNATLSIASALESVEAAHAGSRLIVDDHGLLVGYVTHEQLVDALARGLGTAAVSTIANDDVPHVHGDHPLDVVLARLSAARGAVPVLSRNNVRHVEGIVTLETITKRFAAAP
jgi:CIC family chloride channel protein